MQRANSETDERWPTVASRLRLGDLVPIAVAVAAGCERCTHRLVKRALERGAAKPLVERTLAIVADLGSLDCFARAVGPEVVARMAAPLEAGKKALGARKPADLECCSDSGKGAS